MTFVYPIWSSQSVLNHCHTLTLTEESLSSVIKAFSHRGWILSFSVILVSFSTRKKTDKRLISFRKGELHWSEPLKFGLKDGCETWWPCILVWPTLIRQQRFEHDCNFGLHSLGECNVLNTISNQISGNIYLDWNQMSI